MKNARGIIKEEQYDIFQKPLIVDFHRTVKTFDDLSVYLADDYKIITSKNRIQIENENKRK
jgi:hypothetical protein